MTIKARNKLNKIHITIITVVSILLLNIITPAVSASSQDSLDAISEQELTRMTELMIEHSTYDGKTEQYILNHSIVEQGYITEKQYDEAKEVEELVASNKSLVTEDSGKTLRFPPLIAAAIVVIKAAAVFIGAAVAATMITYVTNWGVSAFCKKYKKKHSLLKSFCSANGF